jgi:hypothetical protein
MDLKEAQAYKLELIKAALQGLVAGAGPGIFDVHGTIDEAKAERFAAASLALAHAVMSKIPIKNPMH